MNNDEFPAGCILQVAKLLYEGYINDYYFIGVKPNHSKINTILWLLVTDDNYDDKDDEMAERYYSQLDQ